MLTHKQAQALEFIQNYIRRHRGAAPSYGDMAKHLKLASKSNVHRLIVALERRGYLQRIPNTARAIRVIRNWDGEKICDPTSSEYRRAMYPSTYLGERNKAICEAVKAGALLKDVGKAYGISKQRVSQIVANGTEGE